MVIMLRSLLLPLCLLYLGCGGPENPLPSLSQVSGIVSLDGKPVQKASVVFIPKTSGQASVGVTDEDGRYVLNYSTDNSGAIIGSHTVSITTGGEKFDESGELIEEYPEILPDKYHANTTLSAEVPEGGTEINFELTSK